MVKGPNKSTPQYVNGGDSWSMSDGNSDINFFQVSPSDFYMLHNDKLENV